MLKKILLLINVMYFIFFWSCAFDLVHVKQIPTQLKPVDPPQTSFRLTQNVKISLGTGYSRELRVGTRWHPVGKTERGFVYKTKDQILTVEASNVYEAYLVVSEAHLVGFYLPTEETFSPLSSKKPLPIEIID